jgi:hypothetical protein
MITVWKFTRKRKTLVGRYDGNANNMTDISNALTLARRECPTGKLLIEGVTLPPRRIKEPELK